MTEISSRADAPPAIHLTVAECDTLYALALSVKHKHPLSVSLLLPELERAVLHEPQDMPAQTISMNSTVEFVDEGNGASRTVKLVYPHEADIDAGRVSILTPVGAGLIGMSAGHKICWPDRDGHNRALRIVSVSSPPLD